VPPSFGGAARGVAGALLVTVLGCGASPRPPATATCATGRDAQPAAASSTAASSAPRAPATPVEALTRLFAPGPVDPGAFTEEFLAEVPLTKIEHILAQMKARYGAFTGARPAGAEYETIFERGTVPTRVVLDDEGRFAGLLFRPAKVAAPNADTLLASFKALAGETSLLVVTEGRDEIAWNADKPLAVGSAFKLAGLAALRAQIDQKKRSWRDVVELKPSYKSLPSGLTQNWPERAPITIDSLATLMISVSDNTAADAVIDIVGRSEVERLAPRTVPFLTTREAFLLKSKANKALLERYRAGDAKGKRAVLAELASLPAPDVASISHEPTALDVEWFFSTRELCALMSKVSDLPLMSVNPGVARAADWDKVAYKGGSEPGVINMTLAVERAGKRSVISATWNSDKAIDETTFASIVEQALAFVHGK
jgi:beta-lactamase class A